MFGALDESRLVEDAMTAASPKLDAIIDRNLHVFDKPGVLSIRPGFRATHDWLTGERAIIVTVREKLSSPSEGEALPSEVEGVPVDVRQASPATHWVRFENGTGEEART
jgi:hypothetical protein